MKWVVTLRCCQALPNPIPAHSATPHTYPSQRGLPSQSEIQRPTHHPRPTRERETSGFSYRLLFVLIIPYFLHSPLIHLAHLFVPFHPHSLLSLYHHISSVSLLSSSHCVTTALSFFIPDLTSILLHDDTDEDPVYRIERRTVEET